MRFGKAYFGLATVVFLMACASLSPAVPPSIDLANFTTKGKATKTVVTSSGSYELYDPLQDPQVKAAFDYVYARGIRYDKDQASDPNIKADLKPYIDFFDKIENIQINDLARSGCSNPTISKCRSDGIIQRELGKCKALDWGSPDLNSCEAKNIEFIKNDPLEVPLGHLGKVCFESDIDFTRLYQRPESLDLKDSYLGISRKESFKAHFSRSCIVY